MALSGDARDQVDLVGQRVVDVLGHELLCGRRVVAEAADEIAPGGELPRDRQRQRALWTYERPMGQDLHAVAQQAPLGARLGAVDSAQLGVRLARIAGIDGQWADGGH